MDIDDIPKCCKTCIHWGWDVSEFTGQTYFFCEMNVRFPVRKKTCGRRVADSKPKSVWDKQRLMGIGGA